MMISVPEAKTPHGKLIETGSVREVPTELTTAISGVAVGNGIDEPLDDGDGNGIGPAFGNCCPPLLAAMTGRK